MQEVVVGTERVVLGELIGSGGEGSVYALNGRSGQAAKVYNAALRPKREQKVRAMIRERLSGRTNLVAFPDEVVLDRRGNFLGFVMRRVLGYRPLHELYSPKSRQRYFPKADYRFLIRAAVNIARAVAKVHQSGCVIGDLNHSGVLVSKEATVALIDADSFQFQLGSLLFPCVVGVPDFTPPELHGVNLSTVARTKEHDNFGLAVAIFQLLFMGRHPYAGRSSGADLSLGDAIAQNRFAFSLTRRTMTKTSPPPGALTLDHFPQSVCDAFENAFGLAPKSRPSAIDWVGVLTELEGQLSHCGRVKSHYYPTKSAGCAWCELLGVSGFDMFLDLSFEPGLPIDALGVEQTINEILAFKFPVVTDLLSLASTKALQGSDALKAAKRAKNGRVILGAMMVLGAVAGVVFAPEAWFVWLGLGVWGGAVIRHRSSFNVEPFRVRFQNANENLQDELNAFVRRSGLAEIVKLRGDLDGTIASIRSIDGELANELIKFNSTREARQRTAYLDQFSVRSARIQGIGPAKAATLISFGIETAADVTQSSVRNVPGFGEVFTTRLLNWRRQHEARFRYDRTRNPQDIADEQALRAKFSSRKSQLSASIRGGLKALRAAKGQIEALSVRARNDQSLKQALNERAQAEQDLKLLGATIPTLPLSLFLNLPLPKPPASTPSVRQPSPTNVYAAPMCPRCGSIMRRRSGKYGQFWGCTRYPRCRGTRS